MGAQSIQKVSVVRNDHRCPLKLPEGFFERSQRLDVQVIRWLIQQNQVGALAESLGQMNPVAFAATQIANALLLRCPLQVERRNISPYLDISTVDIDVFFAI